jgi:hypothetical protein
MEINKYRVHMKVLIRKPTAPAHTIEVWDVFCTSDLKWHVSKDEGFIGGPGQGGKGGRKASAISSSKFSYQYTLDFLCHLAENKRVRYQDKNE